MRKGQSRGASVAVNRWTLDTGSGHDLVDERQVSGISSIHYRKANATLQRPGERCVSIGKFPCRSRELDEDIVPLVLKSTPAVLSLGRCMQDGYAFEWLPLTTPTLTTPSGRRIDLVVEGNVPYLASVSPAVPVLCPRPVAGQDKAVTVDGQGGEPWWDEGDVYAGRPLGASSSSAHLADEPATPDEVQPPVLDANETGDEPLGTEQLDKMAEALTVKHLMTHVPKNPWCPSCQRAKPQRKPCKRNAHVGPVPTAFGEQVGRPHHHNG